MAGASSLRRGVRSGDMAKVIPGVCGICAAQVTDLFRHKRWHDSIDERLGDGQKSMDLATKPDA